VHDPRDRGERRDPRNAQDAPGAIFSRGAATPVSPFFATRIGLEVITPLNISAMSKTMWTLPPPWTHRTRPQGFGNLATNARFPQRPHRSSFSLKNKKNEEQNHSDQPSTKTDHPHKGVPAACVSLGEAYRSGDEGLRRDPVRASALFENSCSHGYGSGCYSRGHMYVLAGDSVRALPWFRKACDRGFGLGCVMLGRAYLDGEYGYPQNVNRAIELFESACEGTGDRRAAVACEGLAEAGFYLVTGENGIPKDKPRGLSLLRKQCSVGIESACANVRAYDK
jgi:TPR repeat protein